MIDYGLEKIQTEIIQTCIEINWSDGSACFLPENFRTDGRNLKLANVYS